jgi:hypothetical protein
MRPRKPHAILASALTLLVVVGFSAPASGGPPSIRGCARASGNCSGKKLDGRHYLKMDLTRSRWVKASLFLASFKFTDLYGTKFRAANLRRADLSHGNRTSADFRDADMSGANLNRADFWGSNLRKANLKGAVLIGTRFDKTNLTGADFTGAYMKFASFNGARICHTVQPNGEVRNDDCKKGGGGNGKLPTGGDCCFPGGPKKDKGDNNSGKDDTSGTDTTEADGTIVGEL